MKDEEVLPWVYMYKKYFSSDLYWCNDVLKWIVQDYRLHRAILMDNCKQDISPSKYITLTKDGISENSALKYRFAYNGIDLPRQDINRISLHFNEMQNIIYSIQELHVLSSKTPGIRGYGYPSGQYGNNIYWRLKFADDTKTPWMFEECVKDQNDYLRSCLNGKYVKRASEYVQKTTKDKQY